jgi:hypothetical protein
VRSAKNISASDRTEALKLIEQMAQLRVDVEEGDKRDGFDEAIVALRREVKSDKPEVGRLQSSIELIKSVGEGITGKAIAATIVSGICKLLGIA